MNIPNVSSIAFTKYGFKVFEDFSRGSLERAEREGGGRYLIGVCEFALNKPSYFPSENVKIIKRNLAGLNDEAIAGIFNEIFNDYKTVIIDGQRFRGKSIHVKNSQDPEPLIFIQGSKL